MHTEMQMKSQQRWDAIVIGSGMGGLTFASLYSQLAGKRVLLLERHYVPGGFTHSFERKGFRWDVGLHYVGSMKSGTQPRQLMDLVTGGQLDWQALPDGFDVHHFPSLQMTTFSDPNRSKASLCERFPQEVPAIDKYFRDVAATAKAMGVQIWSWSLPGWISTPLRWLAPRATKLSTTTVADYLAQNFQNPQLRALLTSHWGDYGLVPEHASFATHALITASYFGGAYYPVGGAERIAECAVEVIRKHGGDCLTSANVDRILVESGAAVGVVAGGCEFRAPIVVSNAGAAKTFELLSKALPDLTSTRGTAVVTLYLGLKGSPLALGMKGENHWIHKSFEHRVGAELSSAFVSFGSLNHPGIKKHTAQVMSVVDPSLFEPWNGTQWKKRGEDYEALKRSLSEQLIALAEQAVPGLRDHIEYCELSTPLTTQHFTGSSAIYGSPGSVERFRKRKPTVRTGVTNLLLAGADACSLGIQGSLMGGVFAAGYALHPLSGFPRIIKAARAAALAR
ncbi:MAG TPA: NAD(P)/FAD-dependent oxidoreductase [Solibacterales bacterium]|nr:NAD(P)/FAD-dependent oxidoreductase [Bryobacterales bacterium]